MTEPPYRGTEGSPPPYGQFPPPVSYPPGPPGSYPPGAFPPGSYPPYLPPWETQGYQPPAYYADPSAPFGRHPLTGEALSDKSKTAAGLLQLIGLMGILGIGRIYLGNTRLGVTQLLVGLLVSFVTCGFGIVVPAIWGIIDAVLIFTGSVRDSQGRPLRDG